MARTIGLDGFRFGWVAVELDSHRRSISFIRHIDALIGRPFDRLAVDMPIGLPARGERACDRAARALLRPHASRVFTGARRGLWDHASQAAANRALKARGEAGVSVQLWNLGPKILEVDAALTPELQARVIESHPELVFLRLNDGRPLPRKASAEGLAVRRALLKRDGFDEIDAWLTNQRQRTGAKPDDVLDACAAAIAAREATRYLPEGDAPRDARGLAMQIWY
jgi:predicted RNase H-like nuclease